MSKEKLDVLGIGNAIVDIFTKVDDDFLAEFGLIKDSMNLVTAEQSAAIYDRIKVEKEVSGGSVANTIYALGDLGVSTGYIGKVASDKLGNIFTKDIQDSGTVYKTRPVSKDIDIATSRCIVLLTPDKVRTMCTYLGASCYITPFDVDESLIKMANITYLEGYLFDKDEAKKAFKMTAQVAHHAGNKIALSLSDPFCVQRHRDEFMDLIEGYVDILFANEDEIKALYQSKSIPNHMPHYKTAVITLGKNGSVIIGPDGAHKIEARTNHGKVVDVTGAGDLYAAGFLYGYSQGLDLQRCGDIASTLAGEIISHIGARPQRSLLKILKSHDLIS